MLQQFIHIAQYGNYVHLSHTSERRQFVIRDGRIVPFAANPAAERKRAKVLAIYADATLGPVEQNVNAWIILDA